MFPSLYQNCLYHSKVLRDKQGHHTPPITSSIMLLIQMNGCVQYNRISRITHFGVFVPCDLRKFFPLNLVRYAVRSATDLTINKNNP